MAGAMIVAAQPEAAEAGAVVLQRGGNAVDAAIACALVQGVVDPQMTGIAGFGSLQAYLPKRNIHSCIDFHGKAPTATRPDMWQDLIEGETRDGFGFILKGRVNDCGYQSVTVPGSLKAYQEAHTAWGSMDWADVVQPAIEQADAGFIVRPHVHFWWEQGAILGRVPNGERLRFSATGRQIYFNEAGGFKRPGERVDNPDLARTLRRIAEHGSDIFYSGEIAEEIAADFQRNGGLLSYADLRDYRTVKSEPLWGSYRGYRVATNQPPGGGVMLLEMLNILENFDLFELGHNSARLHPRRRRDDEARDHRQGYACRRSRLLRRADRAADRKAYAENAGRGDPRGVGAHVPRAGAPKSRDTTQICVVDADGNCASR